MKDVGALTEVSLFILLALYEPRHGYAVMQFIDQETSGRLRLGAGSLYGALNNLADKEWITLLSDRDSRRKKYQISSLGKQVVSQELQRLRQLVETTARMTGEEA
jgi:DNA-binding PadR family transcriptional regulator